ncbi:FliI/YscN family ATPase [uncultured Microbulbifer sp.]|uniref:FliI/YscN family ATPase n=1 Tax=uncultured Microbulbifer sp. TaxID=348147 RepID=UPI002626F7FA|nr:FliI/YscN family ATPase [uncultured Microbulbifer sp.]
MNSEINIINRIRAANTIGKFGKLISFHGTFLTAVGIDVYIGDFCYIYTDDKEYKIRAEVIGFDERKVILMPFDSLRGVKLGNLVERAEGKNELTIGPELIGRVMDPLGKPIDSLGEVSPNKDNSFDLSTLINPFERKKIDTIISTKIPIVDSLLTIGKGQRVGIFSGSGVGKTTLITQLLENADSDVNVIALIGERGREVTEFIESFLGEQGLAKSVIIVASADQPPLSRVYAAYTAIKVAEYFSYQGNDVLLAVDSITRLAMAQREIGLARGEPPSVKGYTPSCYSVLPHLVERAGAFKNRGSITAYYTVLVEGDDMSDPIADYMRGILDGHIVLDRDIAAQGKYPAVNLRESVSRVMNSLINDSEKLTLNSIYKYHSLYFESKSMIEIGAYKEGDNLELDKAIHIEKKINDLLYTGKLMERTRVIQELSLIVKSAHRLEDKSNS